jgi:predicted naringenin-chalcone synthase
LGLAPNELAASRECLAQHGNCSSPTVLMILDRLLRDRSALAAGQATGRAPMVLMAFGPGLTIYAALLG